MLFSLPLISITVRIPWQFEMDSVVDPTEEAVRPKLRPLADAVVVERKIAFCEPDFPVVKQIGFFRAHGPVRYKTAWLI
jgi:hypothetical protein